MYFYTSKLYSFFQIGSWTFLHPKRSLMPLSLQKYDCISLNTTQLRFIDVVRQQIAEVDGLLIIACTMVITMTKTIWSASPIFIRICPCRTRACVGSAADISFWKISAKIRINEPSDQRTFGSMNLRTNEPSEQWTFGTKNLRNSGMAPKIQSLRWVFNKVNRSGGYQ